LRLLLITHTGWKPQPNIHHYAENSMHSAPPKLTVVDKSRTRISPPHFRNLDDLQKPFLHGSLKPRRSRATRLILFPGTVWYLLFYCPGWDCVKTHYCGDRTVVEGSLTIKVAEGDINLRRRALNFQIATTTGTQLQTQKLWHYVAVVPSLAGTDTLGKVELTQVTSLVVRRSQGHQ